MSFDDLVIVRPWVRRLRGAGAAGAAWEAPGCLMMIERRPGASPGDSRVTLTVAGLGSGLTQVRAYRRGGKRIRKTTVGYQAQTLGGPRAYWHQQLGKHLIFREV